MTSRRAPAGHSLLELLVTLALTGLLGGAVTGLLQSHLRLAANTRARTLHTETQRIAVQVLSSETRWLHPLRDVRGLAADSLALRALRASGAVCAVRADGSVLAALHMLRAPSADKDSVLILRDSIQEMSARVLLAEPAQPGCMNQTASYRMRLSVPVEIGDVLLIFEAGAYHLRDRALRYRLGQEGRQPLTAETLDNGTSFFSNTLDGAHVSIGSRAESALEVLSVRLPFLNHGR